MPIINELVFGSLQTGWEGINEFLFKECNAIAKVGGGAYGPEWISYDNYVVMKRAWVDPEFNFGKKLGYTIKKWGALVNNYVDFKYLDMVRAEISHRVKKKARSYNYSYHFDNSHGSGKDCLISINFTKRVSMDQPVLVFNIRTSEVTKRLLFDFLLVQRIGEYIYGHNDFEVHLFAPSFYITAESMTMYNNIRKLKKLVPKVNHPFQKKVFERLHHYLTIDDAQSITYRVHKRAALQVRRDENGEPESGVKNMFAKDLQLKKRHIRDYPKNIISKSQRKKYDRARK